MKVAPWLQAFAAVVVAVLTYHLVKATREYVRMTHESAQAARAQQEDQAPQRAADHDYLGALVEQLREKARALPEGTAQPRFNGRFSRRATYDARVVHGVASARQVAA